MDKTINKYLIALIGAITMVLSFSSCTDQDDIDISYGTKVTLTAAHLFDGFQEIYPGDFDLASHSDHKLRIQVLIYDERGNLCDYNNFESNSITQSFEYESKHLLPGEYEIVSIADFVRSNDGGIVEYWRLDNKDKLDLLSVSEEEVYNSSAFSILGMNHTHYEISDRTEQINIDIRAITALIGIHIWGEDVTGNGIQGYCRLFPYLEKIGIVAKALNTQVSFKENKFIYNYPEQNATHHLSQLQPAVIVLDNGKPNWYMYKAVLPTNNVDMYWYIRIVSGLESQIGFNSTYVESSGQEELFNFVCGEQYDLDLEVDADGLFFQKHNPEETIVDRRNKNFEICNQRDFDRVMDRPFEDLLGSTKDMIKLMFQDYGLIKETETQIAYSYNWMIDGIIFLFDTNQPARAKSLSLLFNENNYNPDFESRLIDLYTKKYHVYTPMTTNRYKSFIDAVERKDATINILLDTKGKTLMISKLK